MILLGFTSGFHDASAVLFDEYKLLAAVSLERLTRQKGDGRGLVPEDCIDEVLDIAGLKRADVDIVCAARNPLPALYYTHYDFLRGLNERVKLWFGKSKPKSMFNELHRAGRTDANAILNSKKFLADFGFLKAKELHFYNHHKAHALASLFFTDWQDALIYTADGGGDNVHYSQYLLRNGKLENLYGDDRELLKPTRIDSLGLAYGYFTQALGYKINRHEGKLTGLSARGKPAVYDELAAHFRVDEDGCIHSDFESNKAMRARCFELAARVSPEDAACSVQTLLENFILKSIQVLKQKHDFQNLGLGGGVFANVKLNRLLAEQNFGEVFIFPAMGDDGLPVGGCLDYLLERDGLPQWLEKRYRLDNVYLGRKGADIDDVLLKSGARLASSNPAEESVDRILRGECGAIYAERMEFGPRALGARTILGAPINPDINNSLNKRLDRSDFMPFAPVVLADRAREIFDIDDKSEYACRFMTITCNVKPEWRDKIPAVVHVDNSARPQTIRREDNPLYYDIIKLHGDRTGTPVLINTSFNVHEEPIVNSPAECARALLDKRVDFIVTEKGVYTL